jgi:hypothetical protein
VRIRDRLTRVTLVKGLVDSTLALLTGDRLLAMGLVPLRGRLGVVLPPDGLAGGRRDVADGLHGV